ncbi:MAG TPA: (2Fe-2S)-binding protein [Cyanobacteria bacterium UBA8553]|nr:(2Fe-2S)-binding protein [Cyanobacteria bacterium UBA8553]HAJ63035.1 (2Fe-2S)-binding protein [Cyanobacteria bacterium UBA8543]
MTLEIQTPEAAQSTSTLPQLEQEQEFNWRHCWYPVAFVQDLPKNRPYSFCLYDEPFVFFTNQEGKLTCLTDRCPHRAAKLSDGQIIDGKIECLYHGWQFGSEGECLHIPQLPADAKIPVNSCVQSFTVSEHQGIVWVWPGEPQAANEEYIPTLAALDKPGFVHTDFMLDLPYDQTYFVENVMDPAHVSVSHHGTRGGGNRKNAKPLDMEVLESSKALIRGRWRQTEKPDDVWKHIDLFAPNLVLNTAEFKDRGWSFGLALYSIPLGKGRCRLLARGYRNFFTWTAKLKPRWLEHWNTNKILEQDLPIIVGQQAQIERLGESLKDLYLPLKTSDVFVIEYRKWLDKFGQSLPFYQGYSTSSHTGDKDGCNNQSALSDRFSRHTQICSSCNRAYQTTNRLKQVSVGVAIALFSLAIVTDSFEMQIAAVSASLGAVALAVIAQIVKTKFERSYKRH